MNNYALSAIILLILSTVTAILAVNAEGITDQPNLMKLAVILIIIAMPIAVIGSIRNAKH